MTPPTRGIQINRGGRKAFGFICAVNYCLWRRPVIGSRYLKPETRVEEKSLRFTSQRRSHYRNCSLWRTSGVINLDCRFRHADGISKAIKTTSNNFRKIILMLARNERFDVDMILREFFFRINSIPTS